MTFPLITLEPEHLEECGRRLRRARSVAFLDYMGVPVRRSSSRTPTSKHRLKMLFSPPTGLTFPLISLEPEHLEECGRRLRRAPPLAFLDYMGVPVRRSSSRTPTSKHRLKVLFSPPTGLTFPLISLEPEHLEECGRRLRRARSVAFLDYMGVPVRRSSSRTPTSKHRLKMLFFSTDGTYISFNKFGTGAPRGVRTAPKAGPSPGLLRLYGRSSAAFL